MIVDLLSLAVLLLTDRVDEWMLSYLHEFDGKEWVSVAKGGLDLGKLETEEEKQQQQDIEGEFKPVLDSLKQTLQDRAKEVRVTLRLTDSPSCLVADEGDVSGYLQRMLKNAGQKAPESKPILEINPAHPLVQKLKADDAHFADWAHTLFDMALLAEGGQLPEPASFVQRMNALLLKA